MFPGKTAMSYAHLRTSPGLSLPRKCQSHELCLGVQLWQQQQPNLWLGLQATSSFHQTELKNQSVQLQESLRIQIHFRGNEALPTGKSQIHHIITVTLKEIMMLMMAGLMDKQGQKPKPVLNGF